MGIPAFVLDTSAAMALFLQEEEGYQIEESLKELISSNGQIIVPSLFWYEVGNTLVSAFNRKRITIEELRGIEIDLAELPIVTDPLPDPAVRIRVRETAVSKKLTFYDASYVELSQRLQLPLKSFDKRMLAALSR